jgi:hypothetical protein
MGREAGESGEGKEGGDDGEGGGGRAWEIGLGPAECGWRLFGGGHGRALVAVGDGRLRSVATD